jgi:ElaB/YqjD/DUF883 family membrane-anchored ribosome-binding protein
MKRSSDIESDSEDTSSSSSDEDEEDDKKKKKNLGKYLNGLCVTGLSLKDASDLDSEDDVCDELSFLHKENEELVYLLDNRDHMLREAKKLRKKLGSLLEVARTRVAELETQVLDSKLEIVSLKPSLAPVCQNHVATGVLLVLGTNSTSNHNTHAAPTAEATRKPANQRGRLDRV